MTVTPAELGIYAGAMFLLFVTPGPVWVAMTARALSGGFRGAWPLAVGVSLGDFIWPFCAILGVTWILEHFTGFMEFMKWVAALTFLIMGALVIRSAGRPLGADSRLTRPGLWPGFLAGVAVIVGNPKAILFYMGMLPGFFDITRLTWPDILVICTLSMALPLAGNLMLAAFLGQARALLTSPEAVRRTNLTAGGLLMAVGLAIPFL